MITIFDGLINIEQISSFSIPKIYDLGTINKTTYQTVCGIDGAFVSIQYR
jgi:hypothetical protein